MLCNCDNPEKSNFWLYFKTNFKSLELEKLIATHYSSTEPVYKLEYDGENIIKTKLKQNGDFRSDEALEILKESDIVITNPPFSLFRAYVSQLMEYEKDFLIIGNNNAVTYKDIFPLIAEGKMWLGNHTNKTMEFKLSDDYTKWNRIDKEGNKYGKVPAITWFTNLDIDISHEDLILYKEYNKEDYPKYDNYDAINVNRVAHIPKDYYKPIGVPITFLSKHNKDQFEILGVNASWANTANHPGVKVTKRYPRATMFSKNGKVSINRSINSHSVLLSKTKPNKTYYTIEGVEGYLTVPYVRIFIRRRRSI